MREKTIFITALTLALACVVMTTYARIEQYRLEAEYSRHGFDRTFVVEMVANNGASSGVEAAQYIASMPDTNDGLLAVFSRAALSELGGRPELEAILPVAQSKRQLDLPGGRSAEVTVYNIPPSFAQLFSLGDPAVLKQGEYVLNPRLRSQLQLPAGRTLGTLGVASRVVARLPADMRKSLDWSKARVPVSLSAHTLASDHASVAFQDALFTTGAEPRIAIPGLFLFPTYSAFIRLRDGADLTAGETALRTLVDRAAAASPHSHLQLTPLPRYFARQLGADELDRWSARVQQALLALTVLVLVLLALIRHRRMRFEIALRRALGAPLLWSVWLSGRAVGIAIGAGVLLACLAGYCFVQMQARALVATYPSTIAPVMAVGALSLALLFALCLVVGQSTLAAQLKHE